MLKIAFAQIEILPGQPDKNFSKIKEYIINAKKENTDIIVFPELSLSGYLIGDLWELPEFINDCIYYGSKIKDLSENICVIFGNVGIDNLKTNNDGHKRKYNSGFIFQNKKNLLKNSLTPFIIKNSLPNYREFNDARYFSNLEELILEEQISINKVLKPIKIKFGDKTIKIGLFICEDGWTENYRINLPELLTKNGAELLINLSCSPFTLNKNKKRNNLFSIQAKTNNIPLIYCNNIGLQNTGKNIFTFDGESTVYSKNGTILTNIPKYKECLTYINYSFNKKDLVNINDVTNINTTLTKTSGKINETVEIYTALNYGIKKFFEQLNLKKITIGLSGGIDSAVTAALFTKILGPENVLLVNMPSNFNSALTISLVEKMANNLKANYMSIPIQKSVDHTINQIENIPITNLSNNKIFNLKASSFVIENIQSRDRGARLIAALAASFGGVFSCNSNKTELSIGYATFYGDISGAIAPIADLWKHQVYNLGHFINDVVYKKEIIPNEIFNIKPSAELSAKQTVGIGGDPLVYEYHDYLFKAFIEKWDKLAPADILEAFRNQELEKLINCQENIVSKTFSSNQEFIEDLEKWWKLFSGFAVAKRIQSPPILTISPRSFGYDYQESQLPTYFSRKYKILKKELLAQD